MNILNIYELEAGSIRRFVPAVSQEDAYKIGSDPKQHPDLHFRPFTVTLVHVDGYTITVTKDESEDDLDSLDRDGLKAWLTDRNIEFTPQWGEVKLRELALQHV